MMYGMSEKEYERYQQWRNNHSCISQVEITIVPDCVQDFIQARCFGCGEIILVTDFSEG